MCWSADLCFDDCSDGLLFVFQVDENFFILPEM